MPTELHRCVVDAKAVINVIAPAVPLWFVFQEVTDTDDDADDEPPTTWSDAIYPVHALGTVPPITDGDWHRSSGAFLIADTASGAVVWVRAYWHSSGRRPHPVDKDHSCGFLVAEKPERGQHPCPPAWRCAEYDPAEYMLGPFAGCI